MTTRIGAPHVGHKATRGGGGILRSGVPAMGCACTIFCRRVSVCMAELACRKPKWRTFMKPSGKTCCRYPAEIEEHTVTFARQLRKEAAQPGAGADTQ
jgi:hypothetical protein